MKPACKVVKWYQTVWLLAVKVILIWEGNYQKWSIGTACISNPAWELWDLQAYYQFTGPLNSYKQLNGRKIAPDSRAGGGLSSTVPTEKLPEIVRRTGMYFECCLLHIPNILNSNIGNSGILKRHYVKKLPQHTKQHTCWNWKGKTSHMKTYNHIRVKTESVLCIKFAKKKLK